MEVKKIGNIFGYTGGNFSGNVYDTRALSLPHSALCKEVIRNLCLSKKDPL